MGGQRQREPKPDTCLACHTGSQTCHQKQLQLICAAAAEVEEGEGAEEGGEGGRSGSCSSPVEVEVGDAPLKLGLQLKMLLSSRV